MIRKIGHIIIWSILIAGVVFALAFTTGRYHTQTVCSEFNMEIINPGPDALTDAEELRTLVIAAIDTLEGKTLAEIDPYDIHLILKSNPYVQEVDVQTSIGGEVSAEVRLRQAILRIVGNDGKSYYMDEEGWLMPVNPGFPARVPVMNGSVPVGIRIDADHGTSIHHLDGQDRIRDIYELALYIHRDPFLHRLISQVWISRDGKLEMIPVIGEYTIKFGGFDDMEKKFENLSVFYREGASKAGWIDYRSIDLRYKNQVICSK
jgi:cell division protein FtsQ